MADGGILVCQTPAGAVVEVRASGNLQRGEQIWQAIHFFNGVNQLCLLPITQDLQIVAQDFFYQFIGLRQEIMFELELADITLEGFKLSLDLFTFRHLGVGFAAFHG